ncbi:MAG: hypothetical protein E5Y67_11250, partial [Mesorhizobium sp.]
SLNAYFDAAIAAGRLYGMMMHGHWITVGTPDAIPLAEAVVATALAESPGTLTELTSALTELK